jgi:hypothetical protein
MIMTYLERQLVALANPRLKLRSGTISHCCIRHDKWCPLLRNAGLCTCNTDMLLLLDDGERYEIRADGSLRKPHKWFTCPHGFDPNYNRHFAN